MRCLGWGLVCLMLVSAGCAGKPNPEVAAAVEQIQKLGGTFVLHGTTIPVKPASKLPAGKLSVQQIDLNQKTLRDEQLEKLKSLTQLEELLAEASYLTDAGLAHLPAFPKLQKLDLHKSRYFTDKGIESLKPLIRLTKLELSYTQITDKSLDSLLALKNLQTLNLSGTRVTSDGLKKLKAGLKNCEIVK